MFLHITATVNIYCAEKDCRFQKMPENHKIGFEIKCTDFNQCNISGEGSDEPEREVIVMAVLEIR